MADKIAPGELMNEVNALTRERDELREHVARDTEYELRIERERDALRAENQRLAKIFHDTLEIDQAEIERLRTALKAIASAADWHPDDMQAFARAACQCR